MAIKVLIVEWVKGSIPRDKVFDPIVAEVSALHAVPWTSQAPITRVERISNIDDAIRHIHIEACKQTKVKKFADIDFNLILTDMEWYGSYMAFERGYIVRVWRGS